MIQTKNNTSIALKIYSVIVLLNAIISLVTSIKTAFFSNSAIPLHYLFTAESLASLIVIGILVINIYKDKKSAALFIPCLTYSIVLVLVLAIFIGIVTPGLYNISNTSSWNVILAGIFLWIALDSRKGTKYPFAEMMVLAVFHVLITLHGLIDIFVLTLGYGISIMNILPNIISNISNLLFSFSPLVIFYLWRRIITSQKRPAQSMLEPQLYPEDDKEISR